MSHYIFENHILLNIIRMLEAAIEKCSKEQGNIKNPFYMLYIYTDIHPYRCKTTIL